MKHVGVEEEGFSIVVGGEKLGFVWLLLLQFLALKNHSKRYIGMEEWVLKLIQTLVKYEFKISNA
jgi:hypothetical protein